MWKKVLITCITLLPLSAWASKLYIPMDADNQRQHLKAYGVVFKALQAGMTVDWLLNYDGGAFAIDQNSALEKICNLSGVDYKIIAAIVVSWWQEMRC